MKGIVLAALLLTFLLAWTLHGQASAITTEIAQTLIPKKYDIPTPDQSQGVLVVDMQNEYGKQTVSVLISKFLFNVTPHYDKDGKFTSFTMKLKPEMMDLYKKVGFASKSQNVAFVYPLFTQAAYENGGFYDYYSKKCDATCLTVPIPSKIKGTYASSISAVLALTLLNYSAINDMEIDKNPDILKKYDRIIVLHNEYVTRKEFNAITSRPNVVYLYPNAMFAQVKTDYNAGTITLVKGHGYPLPSIGNGFGWKYDNSPNEYDFNCDNWQFTKIPHGKMLNCYPTFKVLTDQTLLYAIKK